MLDTHILIWALDDPEKISDNARKIIDDEDNEIYYSAVSIWEIAIKHEIHPEKMYVSAREFSDLCYSSGFDLLPLMDRHILALETIRKEENTPRHKDPFDKVLIAQAKAEGMTLFSHDKKLSFYNEPCVILF